MFVFLVFALCLAAQLFIFFNIGKLSFSLSIILSLQRSLVALLYVYIFPNSDILGTFWSSIDCDSWPYSNAFYLPLSSVYCSSISLDKLSLITIFSLLYSVFGSIAVACLFRSFLTPLLNFFKSLRSASRTHLALYFKIVFYMIIVDPVLSTYSGSISKDIFVFSFIAIGLSFLTIKKNLTITELSALIISLIIVILDRSYLFVFIGLGLFAGICTQISRAFSSHHLTFKKGHVSVIIGSVFFIPLVVNVATQSFQLQSFDLDTILKSLEIFTLNDVENTTLAIPSSMPDYVKYVFFWSLPLFPIQLSLGSIFFSINTLYTLAIVVILLFSSTGSKYKGSLLQISALWFVLAVSLAFSITLTNSGLSARYRVSMLLPPLVFATYDKFLFSNASFRNRVLFNNSQI